jgi:hypothetical protein
VASKQKETCHLYTIIFIIIIVFVSVITINVISVPVITAFTNWVRKKTVAWSTIFHLNTKWGS